MPALNNRYKYYLFVQTATFPCHLWLAIVLVETSGCGKITNEAECINCVFSESALQIVVRRVAVNR